VFVEFGRPRLRLTRALRMLLVLLADQREHRGLRVLALMIHCRPHLHGVQGESSSTENLHAVAACVDIATLLSGKTQCCGTGTIGACSHAATASPPTDNLVLAIAPIPYVGLPASRNLAIERERLLPVGGRQLVHRHGPGRRLWERRVAVVRS